MNIMADIRMAIWLYAETLQ